MKLDADDLFYRRSIPKNLQMSYFYSQSAIRLDVDVVDFLLRDLLPDAGCGQMRPEDEKWQIIDELALYAGDNVAQQKQGTLWQPSRVVDRKGYIEISSSWWAWPVIVYMAKDFLFRHPSSSARREVCKRALDLISKDTQEV